MQILLLIIIAASNISENTFYVIKFRKIYLLFGKIPNFCGNLAESMGENKIKNTQTHFYLLKILHFYAFTAFSYLF